MNIAAGSHAFGSLMIRQWYAHLYRYDHAKQSISHGCARRADSTAIAGLRPLVGRDRTIVETSSIVSADLHENLGQLIASARMNGVTPPWSR